MGKNTHQARATDSGDKPVKGTGAQERVVSAFEKSIKTATEYADKFTVSPSDLKRRITL